MNLHITMTTIPHPDDIRKGCEPQQSQWTCTPDKLVEVVTSFVSRANQVELWKDRGSMVFMIQPLLTGPTQ